MFSTSAVRMVNAQGRVRQEVTDVKARASCCDMQWHVASSPSLFLPLKTMQARDGRALMTACPATGM
jgi:hypothetical protein